ncbi:MAG: ATP-binding cassette domain-containing protein [Bacteroidales bacterium]|nr:ATP-binding cassette domain-containing protein [Bacteroidales bacterium]
MNGKEMKALDISRGDQVALVGDNASGKSRLAAAFAGRTGAKYITFRDSYGSYGDRNFFMQQRWNLFTLEGDPPSAGEALHQEAAESKDPVAAEERLRRLVSLFSMDLLLDKPLVTLSSGELRKYQLTRALLGGPEILVIDNPYIGLDPRTRALLTELLAALSVSTTLVLVLSRAAEIPPFITHVIPVAGGETSGKVPREAYLDSVLPPAVIRLRNVTIRYGERVILDSLNMTVRQGEHWALTGANGSGKSTLLSLICADNPQAYAHDIELFGRPRGSGETIWDIKRQIGFVSPELHRAFQVDAPALDIVTSGHFDTEGLFRRPTDEQRITALQWMEEFGIAHLAKRPFLRLSSGEQRLCLVARAFVKDPPLYILDEPLQGLDETQRKRVKALLDKYCGAPGKTLLMVTHYPEEYPGCIDHSLSL